MGVKVRQKVKGKGKPWWVFVAHNHKRTSRMVGDKDAAEKVASNIRAKLELGEFDFDLEQKEEPEIPTFKEYADSWLTTIAPATCKESTVKSYDDLLRLHVLPEFGTLKLTEINRGKIKDFVASKLNAGKSASTVTHMRNVISNILNKAVDDEVIATNPSLRIGKIVKKNNGDNEDAENEKMDPLTREETVKLMSTALAHFRDEYPLVLLLFRTGMRIGEALALRWTDLDFNGRFIHVQRGLSRMKIQTPKSGKTRRVDMSPQLAEVLTVHRIECKKKGLALGLGGEPGYVFTNFNSTGFQRLAKLSAQMQGKIECTIEEEKTLNEAREAASGKSFVDPDNWRKAFKAILKKAKLRGIRIHDARHTYATLRISKGDNIADVSKQLGHYSVRLTMDVYYHWLPGGKKSEVDALDDVIEERKAAVNEG